MTPRRHDDNEMLAALREIAALTDRPLDVVTCHRLRRPEHPGASTIGVRFGSWPAALVAAGLRSNGKRPYKRWRREEALAAIAAWLEVAEDRRYSAYAAAAREDMSLPLPEAVARLFGGWRGARAALEDYIERRTDPE